MDQFLPEVILVMKSIHILLSHKLHLVSYIFNYYLNFNNLFINFRILFHLRQHPAKISAIHKLKADFTKKFPSCIKSPAIKAWFEGFIASLLYQFGVPQ